MANENAAQRENLGPAERIINTLLVHIDHMVHNRPGAVFQDTASQVGVRWEPVTTVAEDGKTYVYKLIKGGPKVVIEQGEKKVRIRGVKLGQLWEDKTIRDDARHKLAEYRSPGIFPEVAEWLYTQVSDVWRLDNEFAARWASYAFKQDHKDLKVLLAAFLLVQSRKGDPVLEGGEIVFHDEDFRAVGEAMCLLMDDLSADGQVILKTPGAAKNKQRLDAKQLMRIHDLLMLPGVAKINRDLGFGRSARKPFLGRWPKAVEKWLRFRENNPKTLKGLVKSGFKERVKELARKSHYKPESPQFFKTLGWNQSQTQDGRRGLAIGKTWAKTETWEDLTEEQICDNIVRQKLSWKVIVSRVPASVGITRAIMSAAIEAGSLSDKDLIIATPTLEDLGLLTVQDVREKWQEALRKAEDQRASNIARNVKSKQTKEALQEGADTAIKAAVEEVTKDFRIYVMVDISSSMEQAIDRAKTYIEKFLQGFKQEQLHIAVFNTQGREVILRHSSQAGVAQAFRGIMAGGGTDYGSAVKALQKYQPKDTEDVLFIFVGDEGAPVFTKAVRESGLRPLAFGLVPVISPRYGRGAAVRETAMALGLPCFEIEEAVFNDPYAIPRTFRNLIAATPAQQGAVRAVPRKTLVDTILETKLLEKPAWAA